MKTTLPSDTEQAVRFLEELLGPAHLENVGVLLWDGTRWPDDRPRAATLVLRHPESIQAMFGPGTEIGLAEAFVHDDFDVEGDLEAAVELADALASPSGAGWISTLQKFYRLRRLAGPPRPALRAWTAWGRRRHTRERDRRAVSFHYDLSNEFYHLWLDRRMQYSCAYFEHADDDLEAAQTAKLHHICRKLRLNPGRRLLDIGCGWGGLALFAAQKYGARVTGVTLSKEQAAFAADRVREAGMEREVAIELRDYRDVNAPAGFDAVVSVGMAEHVGRDHLDEYFSAAARLLKPGGVFLNHAIAESVRPRGDRGPSFMDEHVFPDSDIPPIPFTVKAAEGAGLEVRDVENLREHYMHTLRHWRRRLEASRDAAVAQVGESTYRVWRLYLAGSAHGFAHAQIAIYQTLLSKPDAAGSSRLPLTRGDWYPRPG